MTVAIPRTAPRMLLIGARGFLGGHVAALAMGRFECLPAGRSASAIRLDITDAREVHSVLERMRPDVVVLAAALSDIDECERSPAVAHRTNVEGAANVARESASVGSRLVFTSTGAIFDGEAPEYLEDSAASPLSVYGRSKAEAEQIVRAECPEAAIARLSLILGAGLSTGTNSWMDRMQSRLEGGQPVEIAADEYRNAIEVETAARWILDLASAQSASGVFHLGSADAMSRFEIARAWAAALGYPRESIVAAQSGSPGRAPRGRCQLLRPARIAGFSRVPIPTCLEAVQRCVHAVA
jgi:dTDP-4-dehydrorhamnose reductase